MHSISEFGSNVPAFLAKLWKMVEDPTTNDLILWSPSGTSFLIRDQTRFCKELLPMYYKHNNLASFIRQLNMYGFHKLVSVESGSTKLEQDETEFHHPCFVRDQPYMLEHIKRKITNTKIDGASGRTEVVNKVLTDVRQMRSRQETMDSRLSQMKMENEALWRELAILRQKHLKQQQIVNKLIQFLVSLVHNPHNTGISVKRRSMPLMLQDKSGRRREASKSEKKSAFVKSPSGPVIHELDPTEYATVLLDTVQEDEQLSVPSSFVTVEPSADEIADDDKDASIVIEGEEISPEHYLIDTAVEMLEPRDVCPTSLLTDNARSCTSSAAKTSKQPVVRKKGRPKKKRPMKVVDDKNETEQMQTTEVTNDVNNIILPEISGTDFADNNFPEIIDTVIGASPNMNHITPDSFVVPVEIDTSVSLDDLTEICRPASLLSSPALQKPTQSVNNNDQILISAIGKLPVQQPEAVAVSPKNTPVVATKSLVNKKYNIGKNASTMFKKNTGNSVSSIKDSKIKSPVATSFNEKIDNTLLNNMLGGKNAKIESFDRENLKRSVLSDTEKDDSGDKNTNLTVACTTGVNSGNLNRAEVDNHIDLMQNDLESLKELLKCDNLSLDANALLGLFSSDDTYSNLDIPLSQTSNEEVKENNSNTVAMYTTPSTVMDLNDVFLGNEWSLPVSPAGLGNASPDLTEDIFPELNTPNITLTQPEFPPAKKKKKL